MTALITLREVEKAYGDQTLFTGLTLHLAEGDRVGIIGPNGAGKTTLLRVLGGLSEPDEGERIQARPVRVGWVEQAPELPEDATLEAVVAARVATQPPAPDMDEAARLVQADVTLGRLGFPDPLKRVGTLSGGWRKRLALAQAVAVEPDLLLLDEPTNHLDLESILWLEGFLSSLRVAFVVISHDRAFLQVVARRVVEVDPRHAGGVLTVNGPYTEFVQRRQEHLAADAQRRDSLRSRVQREVEWLSRGPKARGTKARGRIQEAERLQAELEELRRRAVERKVDLDFGATARKTKRLLVARNLGVRMGSRWLLRELDLLLKPGLRLGLVGPNGSGKTTLLKVLAGERPPEEGTLRTAPGLQAVYFDQQREQLDSDVTLKRALAPDGDAVLHRGRSIHVVSWARRFGFRSDHLEAPVYRLSGGEQAKLLIARLMLRDADLLLLDEPTNDLDIPTLEVLEEALLEFPGAVVMVTHDRYLLDHVVDRVLGLDGEEGCTLYADTDQWLAARAACKRADRGRDAEPTARPAARRPRKRKALTYGEELELEGMEDRIAAAEAALADLEAGLEDEAVLSDATALQERYAQVEAARKEVEALVERWAELEGKREQDRQGPGA